MMPDSRTTRPGDQCPASIFGLILGVALALSGCIPSLKSDSQFTAHELDVASYGLFDLGVADADGDGLLDVYTSNHSGQQSLALNRRGFHFVDVFSKWGLEQDPRFPGLDVVPREPAPTEPGLYVGWRGPDIVVRSHGLSGDKERVSGTIELLSRVTVQDSEGFQVAVAAEELPSGAMRSRIRFKGGAQGYFAFRPYIHALPITFKVDNGVDPEQIYVGTRQINPPRSEFVIHMRDRHGMAWADYNGDGLMDLFVTRGGLRGTMAKVPLPFWDELYVQGPDGMKDIGRQVGLEKHGCPGRQAAWVDFDGDGRLDIYVVCGRGEDRHPNQLFRQGADGHFEDVAQSVGLGIKPNGKFLWHDVDGDQDLDLIWAGRRELAWYENREGHFERHHLRDYLRAQDVSGLRLGDPDGDGDQDVLMVSTGGNLLLVHEAAGLRVLEPSRWGLPARASAAAWVDVDNDGVEELYALPGGLYRRSGDGHYRRSGTLDLVQGLFSPWRLMDAHVTWADMNGDGYRDLVVAIGVLPKTSWWARMLVRFSGQGSEEKGALKGRWVTRVYENRGGSSHWLQLRLEGSTGNRQAIGALADLQAPGLRRQGSPGSAEGARYSQGHYRIYSGLGGSPRLEGLEVRWPDGKSLSLEKPAADRLIFVREEQTPGNTHNDEGEP